jgi:hypothetical protein
MIRENKREVSHPSSTKENNMYIVPTLGTAFPFLIQGIENSWFTIYLHDIKRSNKKKTAAFSIHL